MIRGIIFDHDGTLINSEQMHYESWRDVLRDYHIEFSVEEYILEHNGVPTSRNAEIIVESYGLEESPQILVRKKMALSQQRFDERPSPLMPYAMETLQRGYESGYALAIATGTGRKEIQQTMAAHRLGHFFSAIATRDDVTQSKPAPDVYLLAQRGLGLDVEECVAVEDTRTGVRSAKNAGLRCIAVVNDFSSGQDLSEADYRCQHLAEAFDLILSMA